MLVGDVDGVEPNLQRGVDVAARAVADHPAMRFHDFVFPHQTSVGFWIFFADDFDKLEKSLQAGTLDFRRLFRRFSFLTDNSHRGIHAYMISEMSKRISEEYINKEDDVGLSGLRRFKETYNPCSMLKKYIAYIE